MKNILETIGNTPLIKIGKIWAKFEAVNPSGSIKDRMAFYMVQKAEKRGELKPGSYIIEATSGNTGISFAMISAIKEYKAILVMPEDVGKEKRKLMKFFGAQVVLTSKNESFPGAIKKTKELAQKYKNLEGYAYSKNLVPDKNLDSRSTRIKNVWLPKQFENPDNIQAHQKGLGQEILREVDKIDAFVAGIGTGGTLMGVAKALKRKFPKVKIIGVEAAESPHKIEGISDGIVPKILDFNLIDQIIKIKSKEAISMTKKLAKKEGLLVGISSGANVFAALKLSKKYRNIVTVLPDRGERYLNKEFFNKKKSEVSRSLEGNLGMHQL